MRQGDPFRQLHRDARAAGQAHLGQADQQAAVGQVVAGRDAAEADDLAAHEFAVCGVRPEGRRAAARLLLAALELAQVEGLADPAHSLAQQHDGEARLGDSATRRRGRCLR